LWRSLLFPRAANLDASAILPFGLAALPFYLDPRSALSDGPSDFASHDFSSTTRAE
jgi:hypothetical protein